MFAAPVAVRVLSPPRAVLPRAVLPLAVLIEVVAAF
jgi:hypothetical protein